MDVARKAAIERAAHEPAMQEVLVSVEGACHPVRNAIAMIIVRDNCRNIMDTKGVL
jgi:hypothetical protein